MPSFCSFDAFRVVLRRVSKDSPNISFIERNSFCLNRQLEMFCFRFNRCELVRWVIDVFWNFHNFVIFFQTFTALCKFSIFYKFVQFFKFLMQNPRKCGQARASVWNFSKFSTTQDVRDGVANTNVYFLRIFLMFVQKFNKPTLQAPPRPLAA